jgi:hypothetical protein
MRRGGRSTNYVSYLNIRRRGLHLAMEKLEESQKAAADSWTECGRCVSPVSSWTRPVSSHLCSVHAPSTLRRVSFTGTCADVGLGRVFAHHEDGRLMYVARTRNGFTPAARMQLMQAFKGLETDDCPFINPPEKKSGRWGQDLNKERMKDCIWLGSKVKGQRELLSVP